MQCRYYDYIRLSLTTTALYQMENAAIAVRCAEELRSQSTDSRILSMTGEQIRKGLKETVWEGRMEEVLPHIFIDGAHNEDGIRAFAESVAADGCRGRRILVFSAVADKDYESMIGILRDRQLFDAVAVVGIHSERAAKPEKLKELFDSCKGIAETMFFKDMKEALPELQKRKENNDYIYIAGSLYLAGEVKALAGRMRN